MPLPWENDPIVGQAKPQAAPAPQFPGIIQGRPPAPDPVQDRKDNIDITKGQLDIEAKKLDLQKQQQDIAEKEIGAKLGKEAGFYLRSRASGAGFDALGVGAESQLRASGKGILPDNWINAMTPEQRQKAESYMADFIAASLRYESGAAIPPEEFQSQAKIFFPQAGDSEETLKVKKQLRQNMIQSLSMGAGPEAVKTVDAYLATLEQPQGGNEDAQQGYYDSESGGMVGTTTDTSPNANPDTAPPPAPQSPFVSSVGDIAQGLGDILGIAGNPLNAGINAVAGTNLSTDLGETLRTDILGIPHGNPGWMENLNRFGVSALTGSTLARGAATLTSPGTIQNALNIVGRTPIRDSVAGMGAGVGGYVGKESGIPGGELAGNIVGGLAGYSTASMGNALLNAERGGLNAAGAAAARQGVDLTPADTGGAVARGLTTGAKASPLSLGPIVKATQRTQEQIGNRTQAIAESQGQIVTSDKAGMNVRSAAERFTKQTSERGSRLYKRAGKAAEGVQIVPTQTLAKLDDYIARTKNNPAAPESAVSELERFRANIEKGVNVEGLRDARTMLSQGTYDGKLRSGADKAMWKDILANLSGDIEQGLVSAGKDDAARMFNRADAFWRDRVEHIDEVLQPLLGKDKSGEDIVKAVEAMSRGGQGGNARLSRLLANMDEKEAGQVRAVIIDRLGKATPGAQSAEGDVFAASTFLTNWNKMTPQAKASLFANKELRQNLNDIAKLAESTKGSQAMANHSNTGLAIGGNIGALGAFAVAHPVASIVIGGAQILSGRLLASPAVARLLARTAKMPPEAAKRTLSQNLGVIAGREPALANDISRLLEAVNDNAARVGGVAASPDNQQQ